MGIVDVEITIKTDSRRKAHQESRAQATATPRIPRLVRLMALAIKFQAMVDRGEVRDYADISRLGYVTRARLTQIMNLLLLAPDIQAHIIAWSAPAEEVPAIAERHLRRLTQIPGWEPQRQLWSELLTAPIAQG